MTNDPKAIALLLTAVLAMACESRPEARQKPNVDSIMEDLANRDEPGAISIGDRGPGKGGGFSVSVGAQFGEPEMREVYRRLVALDSSGEFKQFSCGDSTPAFRFRLTLHQAGEVQERLVSLGHTPELHPWGRPRCLDHGFVYVVERTFAQVDTGPSEDYGYKNPTNGQVYPPTQPGERHSRWWPTCQCELRDSVQEWVKNGPKETSLGANAH